MKELEKYLSKGTATVEAVAVECIEGTRQGILADVAARTDDSDGPNVIWIHGAPGSGKSSTSLSAKSRLKRKKRLVTYFRFDCTQASTTTTTALWQHVALALSRKLPSVHSQLLQNVQDDEVNLDSPMEVFEHLVNEPLSNMTESLTEGPLVIVIDGLDECGGFVGRSSPDRQALLQTLQKWSELPKSVPVKLLVTSREEGDIHKLLSNPSISASIHIPSGNTISDDPTSQASKDASGDIHAFLEYRFKQTGERLSLGHYWPGSATIANMTQRAAGNFMWTVTATNFIDLNLDPNEGIELIMGSTSKSDGMKTLYSLYSTILETSFGTLSVSNTETVRIIFGAMVYAKRPLSDEEYSKLPTTRPISPIVLRSIREGLGSVTVLGGSLRFVHKSFDDFLLSNLCSPKFAIDEGKTQYLLARLCISTMTSNSGLRFNMCNLETSSLKNVDIPDVEAKVKVDISPLLSYSCCFWTDHLIRIPFNNELMLEISWMLRDKLLYWFEAMSLLKEMNRVSHALLSALDWSKPSSGEDLKEFIHDARKFIGTFIHPITQSAPHIYLSALPFAPEDSLVAKRFLPQFPRILSLSKGKQINWSSCIFTSEHHETLVNCVAFSPDEKLFISGCHDGTVCICDSETGNLVSGPFRANEYPVWCAFFSPDSLRIWASCSNGQVIGWDVEKGDKYLTFMTGDRESRCCYFNGSPDIVSVSFGQCSAALLWSAETGERLQEPLFQVPTDITSGRDWAEVTFSPDGNYLVWAGVGDAAIRIWNLVDRSEVNSPFGIQDDTKAIRALSFSVDGLYVVSGSKDGEIIIWDAKTAKPVDHPLAIGEGEVDAVAYSHDNRLIVSASEGSGAVMVWNASTHEAILGPLEGHTSYITELRLSRDGRRALSASDDGTVRIWDLGSTSREGGLRGSRVTDGFEGRAFRVAFSPCGKRLVSLQSDGTLSVWDVTTTEKVPLLSIATNISSESAKIIFSPDDNQVVAYDGRALRLLNVSTGELDESLTGDDVVKTAIGTIHIVFRSTDHQLITCSELGVVRAWRLEGGAVTEDMSSPQPVDDDRPVQILVVSPDGLTAFVRDDSSLKPLYYLWSTTTYQPLPLTFLDAYDFVWVATFSPRGNLLITASSRILRIWDTRTGQLSASHAIDGDPCCLAFSVDDRHVAYSTYNDDSVLIWNVFTDHLETLWNTHTDLHALTFSPDGKKLVSVTTDGQIRIWDTSNLVEESKPSVGFLGVKEHMEDGWIVDNEGGLLFWVPNDHRGGLKWPRNTTIIGGTGIPTELDFMGFRYGKNWTECFEVGAK